LTVAGRPDIHRKIG